jgi:hypothetical protein
MFLMKKYLCNNNPSKNDKMKINSINCSCREMGHYQFWTLSCYMYALTPRISSTYSSV